MFFNLDASPRHLGLTVFILDAFETCALFLWLGATFLRRPIRRSLRRRLHERGRPLRIEYGYNLRGQIETAGSGTCANSLREVLPGVRRGV